MAHLEILTGKSEGERVELVEGEAIDVGTARKAGVRLRDRGVSYIHASLTWKGAVLLVEDRKSKTGTTINGAALGDDPVELPAGGVFVIGEVELRFVAEVAAAPEPEPAAAEPVPVAAPDGRAQELEARLQEVEKERQTLSFERQRLLDDLNVTRERLEEAEEIASDGVEHVNAVEERCAQLESELETLRARVADQEAAAAARFEERIAELEAQSGELRSENSRLKKELADSLHRQSELDERVAASAAEVAEAQEAAASLKSELGARVSGLEKDLLEARRAARAAKIRSRELSSESLETIVGSGDEAEIQQSLLAAFRGGNGVPAEPDDESLASLRERVAQSARQLEAAHSNGGASAAALSAQLHERDEALQRLRDEFESKCQEIEELNEEYQQTVEELEKLKGAP